MKTKLLSLLSLCIIITACSSDESSPLDILDQADQGALIVALETQNNAISGETLDGSLEVLLEYSDSEQGQLLDKMNIYTTFRDNSDDGDSAEAILEEVLLKSVDNTEFENGANNLPTYQMNITSQEFMSITNNTNESIGNGDEFFTRLELVLTDGRTFSFAESDDFGPQVATFIFLTEVN